MVSPWLLSESRPWNDADPRVLQQLERVEDVRGLAGLLRSGNGLLGQVDLTFS